MKWKSILFSPKEPDNFQTPFGTRLNGCIKPLGSKQYTHLTDSPLIQLIFIEYFYIPGTELYAENTTEQNALNPCPCSVHSRERQLKNKQVNIYYNVK